MKPGAEHRSIQPSFPCKPRQGAQVDDLTTYALVREALGHRQEIDRRAAVADQRNVAALARNPRLAERYGLAAHGRFAWRPVVGQQLDEDDRIVVANAR